MRDDFSVRKSLQNGRGVLDAQKHALHVDREGQIPDGLGGGDGVVVIGVGNVAVDVARVLVKTPAEMAATDATVGRDRVRQPWVVADGSPAQTELLLAGIVEKHEGYLRVKCRI